MQELKLRGFKIFQDTNMQSFTLDSILLEDFVKINRKSKKILDIGSGNGIISILLSKRTTALIDAVEIQEKSFAVAKKNILENKIKNINLVNEDIKKYKKDMYQQYDIIISNPPYFKYEDNEIQMSKNSKKIIARNELLLTLKEIIKISARLLKNNAHLYLVFRTERLVEVLEYVKENNMSIKHVKFVYTNNEKDSLIVLVDIVKTKSINLHIKSPVFVYKNNEKTEYIKKLYEK